MTNGPLRRAPAWIRVAAALLPLIPAGRYRIAHFMQHVAGPPFLMHLPAALGGFTFHCDIRDSIAREVCFTGLYEPQETTIAARLLRPGMTVVDVGANWGYFTLAAAHWVGRAGRVMAFEPEARLFAMLAENVRRNDLTQVRVHQLAVGAAAGRATLLPFDEASGNWGTSQIAEAEGGAACEVVALDEQLDRERVGVVDIVKIDVEGSEVDVVAGMRRGLASRRYRYILLECHPATLARRGTCVGECIQPMLANGYRAFSIDHSAAAHRRAATFAIAPQRLLRPTAGDVQLEPWPHLFLAAPGAQDPA